MKQTSSSTPKGFKTCASDILSVSYFHTWMNYIISLIGTGASLLFGWLTKRKSDLVLEKKTPLVTRVFYIVEKIKQRQAKEPPKDDISWHSIPLCIALILMIVNLPILIVFVQKVNNCCKCCPTKCFPVIKMTKLKVDEEGNPETDNDEKRKKNCHSDTSRWFNGDII